MFKGYLAATVCAAAMAGALGVPNGARAQDSGEGLELEEVVVTSRKREERLQDVPISANVTSGATLEKASVDNLGELDVYIPNFSIQKTPGNPAIYVRGMGSQPGNLGFEQSVGLFIDGIYAGRSRQFTTPFLDVERVEVLRGPQGALFGKNTVAGAVSITTRGPTQEFEASSDVTATVSGEKGWDATQIVSGPLSDTLAARLAVKIGENDGWLKNTTLGTDQPKRYAAAARLTLDWRPTDKLSLRLKVDGAREEIEGQPMSTVAPGGSKTWTRATTLGGPDYDNTNSFNAVLTGEYAFDSGHVLTSITSHSRFDYAKVIDSDFTAGPFMTSAFLEDFEQTAQELRISSPTGGRLSYIVGAYAHHNEMEMTQWTRLTLGPFNGRNERLFVQESETFSIYAQAAYDITEQLRATVGLRQTWDKKDADQTRSRVGTLPPTWITTPLSGSRDEDAFDPSAQLQYTFNADAMVYASYSKGSKSGGFVAAQSATTPSQFEYEGETARSYEVGAKLMLLDRRVRLNLAAFDTKFNDLQVSVFEATTNSFVTGNAASTKTKGVEVELAARLTSALDLTASGSYLDAKYGDFPGAGCIYPLPPTPPGVTCTQNIGGTRIPRVPKWALSSTLNLDQPLNDSLRLIGGLTVVYRSGAFQEDNLIPLSYQKGYTKLDLRVGLADANDRWSVAVIAKNLADKRTTSYAFGTPFLAGSETYVIDPGRVIALQARLQY